MVSSNPTLDSPVMAAASSRSRKASSVELIYVPTLDLVEVARVAVERAQRQHAQRLVAVDQDLRGAAQCAVAAANQQHVAGLDDDAHYPLHLSGLYRACRVGGCFRNALCGSMRRLCAALWSR